MTRNQIAQLERSRGRWAFSVLRDPLYKSSYALLANSAATTGVGVAYWAIAAHFYSPQTLGRSAALVSALMLVAIFAQLNVGNALPRFIPKAGQSTGKFIAYCYGASSGAALIGGLAFVTVLPRLSSQWHFIRASLPLSVAFVVAAIAWEVFTLQDIVLLSLRQPILVPVENLVYGLAKLLMLVVVVSLLPSTGIFLSWVVPLAITVPAVNWLIFRRYLKDRDSATVPSRLRTREVIHFVSLDYIGSVLSQAYGNLLPLLVLSVLGAAANSSFYIAWTITAGLGLVASNFGMSLLVEGAAAPNRLAELTRGVLTRCIAVTSLGAVLLVLAGHSILEIYGSRYADNATSLLALLSVGTIPSCIVAVAISLDRIAGRVGRATLTRFALTVLILGGSWILVRRVGIDGIALAWGGTNLIVALARFPTVIGATKRRADPTLVASPARRRSSGHRRPVRGHSQLPGLYRHATVGRHRAGHQEKGQQHLSPPLAPQVAHTLSSPSALGSTEQTDRALELLMSLGVEVRYPQ
jgi:O-antigen/teichoic acid export membrane protein